MMKVLLKKLIECLCDGNVDKVMVGRSHDLGRKSHGQKQLF